jgi:ABC-type transport system involved in cytochrome c biogenesis ATPase subunit
LDEVQNQKAKYINEQQKAMLNLTKLTACPSYMWFIDKKLLKDLSEENLYIINNIINIRIKQGGICMILNATQ